MASASIPEDSHAARIAIVEQHIRLENEHDLEGVLRTFGDTAKYDDEARGEHFQGRDGVRVFYEQILKALPDLEIEVQRRHVADDAVLMEVMIRGTHLGAWRGLPATGRRVAFPLCGVYTFDPDDRLAGEKIYYDRGNWVSSTSRKACLGESVLWRLIPSPLHAPLRGSCCTGDTLTIGELYLRSS